MDSLDCSWIITRDDQHYLMPIICKLLEIERMMNKCANPMESPTKLTEFTPLSSELNKDNANSFNFSKFFRRGVAKNSSTSTQSVVTIVQHKKKEESDFDSGSGQSSIIVEPNSEQTLMASCISDHHSRVDSPNLDRDLVYNRSLTNVLRRISNILDRRITCAQAYKDSDFKQYWMPDGNCKECYDCGDKFTTFRRRHHCRVCGQIFCSRCCNQEIPGKIIGCTGDLRVCKYCCKVVLSYLQSTDSSCDSSDLRLLHEDLQAKLSLLDSQVDSSTYEYSSSRAAVRRKNSTSFREEGFVHSRITTITDASLFPYGRDFAYMDHSSTVKRLVVQEPRQLHELWLQIEDPVSGITFQSHRHRLRTYPSCLVGSSIVDWLISQGKVTSRTQGIAICQALIDARYLEPVTTQEPVFHDEYMLYKAGEASRVEDGAMHDFRAENPESQEGHEPSWVKEINQVESYTPSISTDEFDDEVCNRGDLGRLPSSNSLFYLTLDHEENRVSVSKTGFTAHSQKAIRDIGLECSMCVSGSNSANNMDALGRSSINDDLLKGALQADCSHGQEESTAFGGWHSEQTDKQESDERLAFDRLSIAYTAHESNLLNQLLGSLNLPLSWCSIILPIIHKVVETVHLDVKHNSDDIDIRQYVQFKKIPGGSKSDCTIVSGVVCSKNIAHKKMKSRIVNPCIMMVSSPIVYQRQENKFLSLEPAVLQEHDYLKNVVAKVASFKPDLILVEKTVSRVAQEFLLDLELTLVLNVKPSVMERVARCTQGEIVSSIDAQITKPRLGMCHNFRTQNFTLPNGAVKTLMFFDGCAAHLGCTVTLRGAGNYELGKVKQVMQFMLFVAYNWRLECSFLMDEFAMPPISTDECSPISEGFKQERSREDFLKRNSSLSLHSPTKESRNSGLLTRNTSSSSVTSVISQISLPGEGFVRPGTPETPVKTQEPQPEENRISGGWKTKEIKTKGTWVEDSSDPLSLYLRGTDVDADEAFLPASTPELQVSSLPTSASFRKLLSDIVLCASPFIKFSVPYLESDSGRKCELRQFFSKLVYWSKHLRKETNANKLMENVLVSCGKEDSLQGKQRNNFSSDDAGILACHPFLDTKLTVSVDDPKIQAILADFRARGGRLRRVTNKEVCEKTEHIPSSESENSKIEQRLSVADDYYWDRKVDALDPFNHQRLAVLFCSYSYTSNNAPNFCVHPWVVQMDFYGRNDITLGGFLERYCFRTSYMCPSSSCDSPMTEHVRRFVHESGCVHILLRKMDNPIQKCPNSIVTWTWCRKCKQVSPVMPLSMDTWSYSFAKYLELRFHGSSFTRRGATNSCAHSLHQDHYQYFAFGHIVAAFKYSGILLREIEFPPANIECNESVPPTSNAIIEDIKNLAVTGHGVYSAILERLCTMRAESAGTKYEQVVAELMSQQQAERTVFREKIEEIQVKLTSPTVENMKITNTKEAKVTLKALQIHMWKISDCVVNLKRLMAESVTSWNNRVAELLQQKKKEEKHKPSLANLKIISAQTGSQVPSTADCLTCSSPMWEPNTEGSQTHWWKDLPTADIDKPSAIVRTWSQSTDDSERIKSIEKDRSSSDQSTDQSNDSAMVTPNGLSFLCRPEDPDAPIAKSSSANDVSDCSSMSSAYMIGILPGLKAGIKTSSGSEEYDESYVICQAPTTSMKDEVLKSDESQEKSSVASCETKSKLTMSCKDEEVQDVNRADKKTTVKNILSQLLSHSATSPIQLPFPMSEHHLLPRCDKVPIVVYDDEPSSIIAYTLSSGDYEQGMLELSSELKESQTSSPIVKRKAGNSKECDVNPSLHSDVSAVASDTNQSTGAAARKSGVLAFFRSTDKNASSWSQRVLPMSDSPFDAVHYSAVIPEKDVFEPDDPAAAGVQEDTASDGDKAKSSKTSTLHLETQFSDTVAKYYCRVYFADQFRQLRRLLLPEGEESYIRSLSRCVNWQAKGGKSGCLFCKTHDDRFILKQMTRLEVQSFLEFGLQYINYISKAHLEQKPTVLTKIIGVYRIGYRNTQTNAASKMDLLVMENLFYQKNVAQKFDLKGSVRNRLVNVNGKCDADMVLLDENLLKMTCDRPLYIRPHSKTVLALAINNDTQFLSSQLVMDYSLLVGVDDDAKHLVVGIIDYMRTFTWDKKLETLVKSTGILGGQGKLPTVVSPELYRTRFCEAMDRYFLLVPDRWSGLGQGVDC